MTEDNSEELLDQLEQSFEDLVQAVENYSIGRVNKMADMEKCFKEIKGVSKQLNQHAKEFRKELQKTDDEEGEQDEQ